MDLGLECALGSVEDTGHLGEREAIDVAKDHGQPVAVGKSGEQACPAAVALGQVGRFLRQDQGIGLRVVVGQRSRCGRTAAEAVPSEVDDDRGQPATERQAPDPAGFVARHRAIRADEGILRHLLGVARITQEPDRNRVQPILVGEHQAFEGRIEIGGQIGGELGVRVGGWPRRGQGNRGHGVHRVPEHGRSSIGCVGRQQRATIAGVALDDRFDALVASLGGFYRAWLINIGIELGFFRVLSEAGVDGLAPSELAERTGTDADAVEVWAWAADAHELATLDDGRLNVDPDVAAILLDEQLPEFLGGQFTHAVTASMDWDRMAEFFRTGQPVRGRPDRYRAAIERLTVQDIAVFFQEALAELPQLVADLSAGGRVLDVHCGGARWLIAMARRFPTLQLIGVEFEPDSVDRARHNIAQAGLSDRIAIEQADVATPAHPGQFDLAYFQYALHALPDPRAALASAWAMLSPGGRLLTLDWPLPSTTEEFRTRHGELIAGVQLDEIFQGTRLENRETFAGWFRAAGLPDPQLIDLPSGASVFLAQKPA
jgi:SAM-dependent methyltransferase